MTRSVKSILPILFLICVTPFLWAEEDPCIEMSNYYHITTYTDTKGGHVAYDLSRNHTIEPPHVDSVWIISEANLDSAVLTSYAQSNEWIDISWFNSGYYLLSAFVGDCVLTRMFIFRKYNHTNVEGIPEEQEKSTPWKKIQEGVVVIETESGIYTMHGDKIDRVH